MNSNNNNRLASIEPTINVQMDRMYEIARQLAECELKFNNKKSNELLDTSLESQTMKESANKTIACQGIYDGVIESGNYCEVVSVPTSAHVAQIVGKQGSKIKLLRSKSQTYIQTPVSGEEPVFIITGRREDVLKVKAEILWASEHFTAISVERRLNMAENSKTPGRREDVLKVKGEIMSASEHFTAINEERKLKMAEISKTPGSISVFLSVRFDMIGLIVGRNGNTISNIEKMTNTFIENPKSVVRCGFKITGQKHNVESAKNAIISHVRDKTKRNFTEKLLENGDIQLVFENNSFIKY